MSIGSSQTRLRLRRRRKRHFEHGKEQRQDPVADDHGSDGRIINRLHGGSDLQLRLAEPDRRRDRDGHARRITNGDAELETGLHLRPLRQPQFCRGLHDDDPEELRNVAELYGLSGRPEGIQSVDRGRDEPDQSRSGRRQRE